jgi:hypothetical protein
VREIKSWEQSLLPWQRPCRLEPKMCESARPKTVHLMKFAKYSDTSGVAPASCRHRRMPPGRRRYDEGLSPYFANISNRFREINSQFAPQ